MRSGRLVDAQPGGTIRGVLVYGNADPRVDKVIEQYLGIARGNIR